MDATCKYSYETNNEAEFQYKDIRNVTQKDILPLYSKNSIKVLAGCATMPALSLLNAFKNKTKDKEKYSLLDEFGRLVKEVHPDIVTMENVPAITSFKLKSVLSDFIKVLQEENFFVNVSGCILPQLWNSTNS